jgi:hypothetical protein
MDFILDKKAPFFGNKYKTHPFNDAGEDWPILWKAAIEEIEANQVGGQLLKEIRKAERSVTVRRANDGENMTWTESPNPRQLHYCALNDVEELNRVFSEASKNGARVREIVKSSGAKVTWKSTNSTDVSVSEVDLSPIAGWKLLIELEKYNCLKTGGGMNCFVRWDPKSELATDKGAKPEFKWQTRPPWIALAHELIHAWRYVTGRMIFPESENISDERLTTGLAPYPWGKYTENGVRYYAGQVMRTSYGTMHK